MEDTRYFLCPRVYLCSTKRYVVVFDAPRDRYLCIPRRRFDPLTPWLSGWAGDTPGNDPCGASVPSASITKYAATLVSQGILTADPVLSRPVCPIALPLPRCEARSDGQLNRRTTLARAPAFLLACHRASRTLARERLGDVIQSVERKRQEGHERTDAYDVDGAVRLSRVFTALRPLYPRPYRCTFDSLALLDWCTRHGILPHWVFGVQPDPFQAHCWLQLGDVLLNDRIDRIAAFTPILAV